jgi:hypothetical protein
MPRSRTADNAWTAVILATAISTTALRGGRVGTKTTNDLETYQQFGFVKKTFIIP